MTLAKLYTLPGSGIVCSLEAKITPQRGSSVKGDPISALRRGGKNELRRLNSYIISGRDTNSIHFQAASGILRLTAHDPLVDVEEVTGIVHVARRNCHLQGVGVVGIPFGHGAEVPVTRSKP